MAVGDCPALAESDGYPWLAGLGAAPHPALDAIAGSANARARCPPVAPGDGELSAWEIAIDATAPPREPPAELGLARISRGADFRFEQRRALPS